MPKTDASIAAARPRRSYNKLSERLRQFMEEGHFRDGDRLPPERALAETYRSEEVDGAHGEVVFGIVDGAFEDYPARRVVGREVGERDDIARGFRSSAHNRGYLYGERAVFPLAFPRSGGERADSVPAFEPVFFYKELRDVDGRTFQSVAVGGECYRAPQPVVEYVENPADAHEFFLFARGAEKFGENFPL